MPCTRKDSFSVKSISLCYIISTLTYVLSSTTKKFHFINICSMFQSWWSTQPKHVAHIDETNKTELWLRAVGMSLLAVYVILDITKWVHHLLTDTLRSNAYQYLWHTWGSIIWKVMHTCSGMWSMWHVMRCVTLLYPWENSQTSNGKMIHFSPTTEIQVTIIHQ